MIRSGKDHGWLKLPWTAIPQWSRLNGVVFNNARVEHVAGRGGALIAARHAEADHNEPLLTVPSDLILSLERIRQHAKADQDFAEILQGLGEFGTTPRGAILSFLLVQATLANPDITERHGVSSPFTEYIKFLPLEQLPTTWNEAELAMLPGTSLASAVKAKLKSLLVEFGLLCESAKHTRWYQTVRDIITFDDWLQVDSIYRSRAIEFPATGHCMIPCIDIANHASGDATKAFWDTDNDGNAVLLLYEGKHIDAGEEITITYGDGKGACEMLHSYGFIEETRESAETVFLGLSISDHDSAKDMKMRMAKCAPGFKLIDAREGKTPWTGDFIWMLCVTDEDQKLRFEIARTIDGKEETQAFWGDKEVQFGALGVKKHLMRDPLWDVYQLRAVAILQDRVYAQLQTLYETQDAVEGLKDDDDVRENPYRLAMRIRELEFALLEKAYENFEEEKVRLSKSETVRKYLEMMNAPPQEEPQQDVEEDFS